MMSASRTICSRCASQLTSRLVRRHGTAAAFSSTADAASEQAPPSKSASRPASGLPDGPKPSFESSMMSRRRGHQPKSLGSTADESAAMALFNDVVTDGKSWDSTGFEVQPKLGAWEIAGKLNELARRNEPGASDTLHVKEVFLRFRDDIWPLLMQLRQPLPRHLLLETTQFFSKLISRLNERGFTGDDCCLTISQMNAQIGRWDPASRNALVLNLCFALTREQKPERRTEIKRDIVALWKHISQLVQGRTEPRELSFFMPTTEELDHDIGKILDGDSKDMDPTTRAIAAIFCSLPPSSAASLAPGLVATVASLSSPETPEELMMDAAPLLDAFATVQARTAVNEQYVRRIFDIPMRFPPRKLNKLRDSILEQWLGVTAVRPSQASALRGASQKKTSKSLQNIHKQLRQAYNADNTGAVLAIWKDLKSRLENNPDLKGQLRSDPEFLDFWHFIWCAVRKPNMLAETQQLMQDAGVNPTIKTYTAMMHGWKMSRELDRIESLWDVLVQSKTQLDLHIWVERVSALIELGQYEKGVRALAEMASIWKKASEQNHTANAVQPNTEVVNAALQGLLRHDRSAANSILAWAGREGIRPDIRTYNILLKESFTNPDDSGEDVPALLQAMKDEGIQPDPATFTIILEVALGALHGTTAQQQIEAVHQVISDLDASGLQANQETYGKMLHAVASLPQSSDEALEAVMSHMRSQGWSITPHMVTILINRLMQREPPPKSGTITSLLQQHRFTSLSHGDQAMWERVVSAYSVCGGVSKALAIYNEMCEAGRPPIQRFAIRDLMMALVEDGKREEAKAVVNRAMRRKTDPEEGMYKSRYWHHHLWHLAHSHRLLDLDTAPLELRKILDHA